MPATDFAPSDLPELNQLRAVLRNELSYLRQRFAVRALGIFGSYVRGEQTATSDVDVLVEFDETPSLLTFIALENYLSDKLGVKVDLVMRDALKPRIGEQILREVVSL
jgi:predicted nucleotidyltransferase